MKKTYASELGRRERQIMDAIHHLGEGSVGEVRAMIPDPPSYSSVRTMVRLLESKGFLTHRQDGKRYVYRSKQTRAQASKSALKHLVKTFFSGSASDAVAAIIDSEKVSDEELKRIESIIQQARKEGR